MAGRLAWALRCHSVPRRAGAVRGGAVRCRALHCGTRWYVETRVRSLASPPSTTGCFPNSYIWSCCAHVECCSRMSLAAERETAAREEEDALEAVLKGGAHRRRLPWRAPRAHIRLGFDIAGKASAARRRLRERKPSSRLMLCDGGLMHLVWMKMSKRLRRIRCQVSDAKHEFV